MANRDSSAAAMPKYGWKVKLDHAFPEKRNQNIKPRFHQLFQLLPLFFRYIFWYIVIRLMKRKPFIDCVTMINSKRMYGVPMGGIGSGTIGRGFRGEFCRFQMLPGIYEYNTVAANQFIVRVKQHGKDEVYQKVLTSQSKPWWKLSSWKWDFPGSSASYCGLYPRAWTEYNIEEYKLKLICRQISPVIPHNYKDSCIPATVFVWTVENNSDEKLDISLVFTFKNGTGSSRDKNGNCRSKHFSCEKNDCTVSGVLIRQDINKMECTYGIAAKKKPGIDFTYKGYFDPKGNGSDIWNELHERGTLAADVSGSDWTASEKELASAICSKCTVESQGHMQFEHCLVWDMPKINFYLNKKQYYRRYTRFFGKDGQAAEELAWYSLHNYPAWEQAIEAWQEPILQDPHLPDWYKSALFNELYFVSDGGTVWLEANEDEELELGDPRHEYGRFAYLEGQEYRMYNTYDVHFYASFALAILWPKLQKVLQYDMCKYVELEDPEVRSHLYDGKRAARKTPHAIPHDIGDPYEEPFLRVNAYCIHDVGEWKDLNLKFVLQVFRDFQLDRDRKYLEHMWPMMCVVMEKAMEWDLDGDGLIENSGRPDQTYDSWVMTGPSAYCGGLWLASLYCMKVMAKVMEDAKLEEKYALVLTKAQSAFEEKLWTGQYYKFDCSSGEQSKSIMADQLCGHWYLRASNVTEEVFPKEHVKAALRTVFNFNVMKFVGGKMGAVNGMLPNGSVDIVTMQSEEMWTGVGYALAATMIHEGLIEEGFKTAEGIYRTVYERIGLGFETPEALYETDHYRALGYMRPLSIWAVQLAWEKLQQKKGVVIKWGE